MPRIEINLEGDTPRAATRRSDTLQPGEVTTLVAIDSGVTLEHSRPVGDRFVPLSSGRWAVGRGVDDDVIWRIAGEDDYERMRHPGWLWTKEQWFSAPPDQKLGRASLPLPLPLRSLLRLARPLCGNRRKTHEAIAEIIQELRKGRQTVAVVLPDAADQSELIRWLTLALIACLPPFRRTTIRVSTFEPNPKPDCWDLLFTDQPVSDGFTCIDIRRPKPKNNDMVVYYVLNRLRANDPEAVEFGAFLEAGEGPDPWGDGIRNHLQAGIPGVSAVDAEMLQRDPDGSVEAVLARIRSGTFVADKVADDIAAVTKATGDARPWRALVSRSAEERINALKAWLPFAQETRPTHSLLRTIAALYPREESPEPWFRALLAWYEEGYALDLIKELLSSALLEADQRRSLAINAAIWCELILTLSRKGRPEEALEALLSPVADTLARTGVARSLVLCWMSIPRKHQTLEHLRDLIDLFVDAPDGDEACAMLFRNMIRSGETVQINVLLKQWAFLHPGGELREGDALLDTLVDCNQIPLWIYAVAATAEPEDVVVAVRSFVDGSDDPAWTTAEQAIADSTGNQPRERFVNLANFLPDAMEALEETGLQIAEQALQDASLPDPEIASVASEFTDLDNANTLWMWLTITASAPDRFDEATLDASVTAFAECPPERDMLRAAALNAAAALGVSPSWTDGDLAAWLVRLCLAPDGDDTGFNYDLARTIVHAIPDRADGASCLATITNTLTGLPIDHPVLWIFLEYLLPDAWPNEVPDSYLGQVKVHSMADEIHTAWAKALD